MILAKSILRQSAGDAALMLRSLAHQDRLLLLCQLSQGELFVSDLEARLEIQQPNLSQQLGVLRREGLLTTRRTGKYVFYRIGDERVMSLLQTLCRLFCEPRGEARQWTAVACSPRHRTTAAGPVRI